MDILVKFEIRNMPPALFETLAYALHRVGYYVGRDYGQSFSAHETWERMKGDLSEETICELYHYALQKQYFYVRKLLNELYDRYSL